MFGLDEVVLTILKGAASSLTSRLMERKKDPIDIRQVINEVVDELRKRDKELEVSIAEAEITTSLKSLKTLLTHFPEFDVKANDIVVFQPQKTYDLGDILYRLDEEIAALYKSSEIAYDRDKPEIMLKENSKTSTQVPSILQGLDEEIASLRSGKIEVSKNE